MNYFENSNQWLSTQQQQLNCNQEFDIIAWDYTNSPPNQIKIQIVLTQDKKLNYLKDGAILRSDLIQDSLNQQEILTNLEQIQFLKWQGKYGQNHQKIGKWTINWQGEILNNAGGQYCDSGNKQGLWNEPIKNFCKTAQAYEVGEYLNNQRIGTWKYIYEGIQIGGGEYNEQGRKQGKWIELSDGFLNYQQITYKGQYQNDTKVGQWEIFILNSNIYWKKLSGNESYNEEIKIGSWIEICEGFCIHSQVFLNGEYKDGQKFGKWKIFTEEYWMMDLNKLVMDHIMKEKKLEGGLRQVKGFCFHSQVLQNGEYKNNQKFGKWNILYRKRDGKPFEQIGGGQYDVGIKIGKWIELSKGFGKKLKVIQNGEYKNGKKVGRWIILFKGNGFFSKQDSIGGGMYNEGIKTGKWIELYEGFTNEFQLTYYGEYENGKKVGRWIILYNKGIKKINQLLQHFPKISKIFHYSLIQQIKTFFYFHIITLIINYQ